MDPTSAIFGWSIFFATGIGPVLAVLVTRWIDYRREVRDRQMRVFRHLMANRRSRLSLEFVSALNLIEIEFYADAAIIERYKELLDCYSTDLAGFTEVQHEGHTQRVEQSVNELLQEIGRKLGYKVARLDLRRGGYSPSAWVWREERADLIQRYLTDVAMGRKSIPVALPPANAEEAEARKQIQAVQSGQTPLQVRIVTDEK